MHSGLRASDTGELMRKGWTIATSHAGVLKHMHLPCQKNRMREWTSETVRVLHTCVCQEGHRGHAISRTLVTRGA